MNVHLCAAFQITPILSCYKQIFFHWETERWGVLLCWLLLLLIYTQWRQAISHTILLQKLPLSVEKHRGAQAWGVNGRFLSWSPSLCYRQKSSFITTHSSVRCIRPRIQTGVKDLFHPNTSTFSTQALIWVHFNTVHYFFQPIFSLLLHLKRA